MNLFVLKLQRWKRWRRHLAAALMLHVLLLAGLYVGVDWLSDRVGTPAERSIVVFELVAPATVQPQAPAQQESEALLPASPSSVEVPPPVPIAQTAETGAAAASPRRALQADSQAGDAQSAAASAAMAQGDAADGIGTSTPAPQTAAGDAGEAARNWEAQLLQHLDRYKRYPAWAERRGQEDVVQLQVRVDRDGQVVARRIVGGRGYALLDEEALALLARASPLPPPPPEVAERDLEFRLPVAFYIDRRLARLW
jgi:periplasmic protein TonB